MYVVLIYLLLVNLCSYFMMGADKRKAQEGTWRTPEATFMTLAVIGGAPGIMLGMKHYHHKTKHAKFTIGVPVILCVQIGVVIYYFYIINLR